jgi:predicted HAD superfamily Cof-like phosphohydrolase
MGYESMQIHQADTPTLTPQAAVAEFHRTFGLPVADRPTVDIPSDLAELRIKLLTEEVGELLDAVARGDLVGIADALADIDYVTHGTALTYGIDLDAVVAEVHRSNMTKQPGPTGKAVKGDRYEPPKIADVLLLQGAPCGPSRPVA